MIPRVLSVQDFGEEISTQRTSYEMYIAGELVSIITFGL
jgi:hypothetical protein